MKGAPAASSAGSRVDRSELGRAARAGTLLPATPGATSDLTISDDMPRLEQIRRAGCQLFYQYGYSGMTMRLLAARLNIKAASLYHHFPSKQDILFYLMYDTAIALMEGLLHLVGPDEELKPGQNEAGAAREQLTAAIRWHVLFHTQKREEAFISHSELRSLTAENLKEIMTVRQHYDQVFDFILQRCQDAGVIPERDTSVVRNAILTMCTATAGWFHPEGKLTAEQVADQMVEFVWGGLLAEPTPGAEGKSADKGVKAVAHGHREAPGNKSAPAPETRTKAESIMEGIQKLKKAKLRQLQREKSQPSG